MEHGLLAERNLDVAEYWYSEAANHNYPPAQLALSNLLCAKNKYAEAVDPLIKAAESGYVAAQYALASYYFIKENNSLLGYHWLEKAAGQGHALANEELAEAHFSGTHPDADRQKGLTLLERGAELGDMDCALRLANHLLEQEDSKECTAEGLRWLRISAGKGNPMALMSLFQIYSFGIHGVTKDDELASVFLNLSRRYE